MRQVPQPERRAVPVRPAGEGLQRCGQRRGASERTVTLNIATFVTVLPSSGLSRPRLWATPCCWPNARWLPAVTTPECRVPVLASTLSTVPWQPPPLERWAPKPPGNRGYVMGDLRLVGASAGRSFRGQRRTCRLQEVRHDRPALVQDHQPVPMAHHVRTSCSTRTIAVPCALSSSTTCITRSNIPGDNPADGSSRRSTRGSDMTARAIARSWSRCGTKRRA